MLGGPVVAAGYLDPSDDEGAFDAGRFRTGDLGRVERGRLTVLGRADDMINTGGEKVAPAAVERALLDVPGVRAACVTGLADAEWGQVVAALVVADPGLDDEALRAAVRGCPDLADVEVSLTTTKTADALGTDVAFRGSAREAGLRFPKTANVAVALGLATVGIDNVDVTVVADPTVTRTRHRIRLRSPIGDYEVTAENALATGSGGRTSALTAWSVISTLEALALNCSPALLLH